MKNNRFKQHLFELKRLRIGAHIRPHKSLFLDRNERVMPYGKEISGLLCKRLSGLNLNLYPEVEKLYSKLAGWLSVDEKQIYITEGVSGAIKSLIETIANKGDNIIFPTPTFALYPVYCKMYNLEFKTVGYKKDYSLDLKAIRDSIDDKTAIVFLPNPNSPIEGTIDLDEIVSLAKRCARHGTFLVMDEVYFPFGGPTAIGLIRHFDNIFVMRSFSKAFGLAGIRVGYMLGSAANINYVSKTRTGYETNSLSMEAASFFIDNYRIVEDYIRRVREGLAYAKRQLDLHGLEYNGGNTSNFIYVNMHDRGLADDIVIKLRSRDIYIRGGWPAPYDGGFSVTGAPKPLMRKFMKELTRELPR